MSNSKLPRAPGLPRLGTFGLQKLGCISGLGGPPGVDTNEYLDLLFGSDEEDEWDRAKVKRRKKETVPRAKRVAVDYMACVWGRMLLDPTLQNPGSKVRARCPSFLHRLLNNYLFPISHQNQLADLYCCCLSWPLAGRQVVPPPLSHPVPALPRARPRASGRPQPRLGSQGRHQASHEGASLAPEGAWVPAHSRPELGI